MFFSLLYTPRTIYHLFLVHSLSQGSGLYHVVFLYKPQPICHLFLVHSSSQGRSLYHVAFATHPELSVINFISHSFLELRKWLVPCCFLYTPRTICHLFLVHSLSQGSGLYHVVFSLHTPNNLSFIPRLFLESRKRPVPYCFLHTHQTGIVLSSSQGA